METDKQTVKDTGNMRHISASLDVATLKKRTKFRYKGCLYHVVDKCYDNDTTLIIVKYFGKYKKMVALRDFRTRRFR